MFGAVGVVIVGLLFHGFFLGVGFWAYLIGVAGMIMVGFFFYGILVALGWVMLIL